MPELPEVETIRIGLAQNILGKNIADIHIAKPNLVRNNLPIFRKKLKDNSIIKIDRVGKLLLFDLYDGEHSLAIHLKMTGQLIYVFEDKLLAGGHNLPLVEKLPNKYSHIILTFEDNSKLFFNDMRQFGFWQLLKKSQKEEVKKKYGLEPLTKSFTWANFKQVLQNKKSILKPTLLNQQIFAGIGNIYADEICFRAGVLPHRRIDTLSEAELKKIYKACQYIIAKAIAKKGTTFSDYRSAEGHKGNYIKYLKVYGRKGEKCLKCKQENIIKVALGGRGTHYCPNCQH